MSFGSISRLFMSALYIVVGLVFLFTDVLKDRFPEHRQVIGGVLVGYGIIRFVLWQRWNKTRQQDQP